jgi:hypothetical protein
MGAAHCTADGCLQEVDNLGSHSDDKASDNGAAAAAAGECSCTHVWLPAAGAITD